jgi:surface polysaccharide O-acyltransferase-like enzyme
MEPEAAAFLRRVANSIAIGFIWLAVNAVAAIKGDNAFIGDHLTIGNVLYYIWFVTSIVILVIIYKKIWVNKHQV